MEFLAMHRQAVLKYNVHSQTTSIDSKDPCRCCCLWRPIEPQQDISTFLSQEDKTKQDEYEYEDEDEDEYDDGIYDETSEKSELEYESSVDATIVHGGIGELLCGHVIHYAFWD
jgi:hypothetical protein